LVKGFFQGEDAYFVSFFVDKKREVSTKTAEEDEIISKCDVDNKKKYLEESQSYVTRNAEKSDIPQMIKLFLDVFKTYPSPVFSSDYLQKIMKDQVLFKVAVEDDRIISIASADMDKDNLNAEITDCATYPEHRGRGILPNLIHSLEQELSQKGFYTLYSLSRAINLGINRTLRKLDYRYCGRLVNNCHICGGFEDMNIWVKNLNRS
jgi:putative beta-lysine N-acetyltransferase